jgi:hypothetical protein
MESWKRESYCRTVEAEGLATWSEVLITEGRPDKVAPYTRRMIRFAETHPNCLIIAPPGSRKSTYVVEDGCKFELCKSARTGGDWTALVVRRTGVRGIETMDAIRADLHKQPMIRRYYGEVIDPDFDRQIGIRLLGRRTNDANPNLRAIGLDGDWGGRHPHGLFFDDIAELENQRNSDAIARLVHRIKVLLHRVKKWGRGVRWVNNFIRPNDAPQLLMKEYFRDCTGIFPAELPDGKSAWPEQWADEPGPDADGNPRKTLQDLRQDYGDQGYRLFFKCEPIVAGPWSIPSDAFRFWSPKGKCPPGEYPMTDELRARLHIRYGIDPGGMGETAEERRSCRCGLVKTGVDPETGYHFVLRHAMLTGSAHESAELFQQWFEDEPGLVTCERTGIGEAMVSALRSLNIPSRNPHAAKGHEVRMEHVRLRMESGRVYLYHEEGNDRYPTLERQLRDAPDGRPNDGADAFFYSLEPLRIPGVDSLPRSVDPGQAPVIWTPRQEFDPDSLPDLPADNFDYASALGGDAPW